MGLSVNSRLQCRPKNALDYGPWFCQEGPLIVGNPHMNYRQNPKVEMLSRTWAPSVLGYPFVLRCFCLNFGAFAFGLPLRFTGFWHEITRRLLAEVQHFACRSYRLPEVKTNFVQRVHAPSTLSGVRAALDSRLDKRLLVYLK